MALIWKRSRVVLLATVTAVVVVLVGLSFSLEPQPSETAVLARTPLVTNQAVAATTVVLPSRRANSELPALLDGATLFLVGAGLIGLAGAIRRRV